MSKGYMMSFLSQKDIIISQKDMVLPWNYNANRNNM